MSFVRSHWAILSLSAGWIIVLHFLKWPALLYTIFPKTAAAQPSQNEFWDSAIFAMAGELLRHGAVPYHSYWEHAPPLIHLLNAGALQLSQGDLWGIWLSSLAVLLVAFGLGFRALQRAFGEGPAVLGMAFFAASLSPLLILNSVEEYGLPLQWATVLLLVCQTRFAGQEFRLGAALGGLAALAFLLRPNLVGAPVSGALVLSYGVLIHRELKGWLWFMGGALGCIALVGSAVAGYLLWEGSFLAFWDQVVRYNYLLYSATDWKMRIRAAHTGLRSVALSGPLLLPLAGWMVAVIYRRGFAQSDTAQAAVRLAIVWLPIELVLASVFGRDDSRYFLPLLAPLAFLTALLAAEWRSDRFAWASLASRARSQQMILVLSLALFVLPLMQTLLEIKEQGSSQKRVEQIQATVEYIQDHTDPHEAILVWGHAPELYLFSARPPATRFLDPVPLLTPGYADVPLIQRFVDDLRASSPSLIIEAATRDDEEEEGPLDDALSQELTPRLSTWDSKWRYPDARKPEFSWWRRRPSLWSVPPALKEFYDLVAQHYTVVSTVGPQQWVIYRRAEAPMVPGR